MNERIKRFFPEKPVYVCEFVKNGEIILGVTGEQLLHSSVKIPDEASYDFFVFSDYEFKDNEAGPVPKIIEKNIKEFKFENVGSSSVKFILAEITIGVDSRTEKTIPISFRNDKYDYLRKNNIIDKNFMRYFMKKHYNKFIYDNDMHLLQNYKLKIIDDNIKVNILDNTCKIIMLDNTYEIQTDDDFVKISNNNK